MIAMLRRRIVSCCCAERPREAEKEVPWEGKENKRIIEMRESVMMVWELQ